jgi:hypothetical protein
LFDASEVDVGQGWGRGAFSVHDDPNWRFNKDVGLAGPADGTTDEAQLCKGYAQSVLKPLRIGAVSDRLAQPCLQVILRHDCRFFGLGASPDSLQRHEFSYSGPATASQGHRREVEMVLELGDIELAFTDEVHDVALVLLVHAYLPLPMRDGDAPQQLGQGLARQDKHTLRIPADEQDMQILSKETTELGFTDAEEESPAAEVL